jgi:hypothetical protein
MTTRSRLRVFRFEDYESTTISKKALCQLQDCKAQERGARDLQEPAPQTTPGIDCLTSYRTICHAQTTRS